MPIDTQTMKAKIRPNRIPETNNLLTLTNRIIFTGIVSILSWSQIAWDYFHGGVPSHHILHRPDLPGISNWWGAIVIPLVTWFLLNRIKARIGPNEQQETKIVLRNAIYGFASAILFGVLFSVAFSLGSNFTSYMLYGLFILSFFLPIYRAEYLLGFVLAMAYTFGGILPIGIGIILTFIFLFTYKVIRTFIIYLFSKVKS